MDQVVDTAMNMVIMDVVIIIQYDGHAAVPAFGLDRMEMGCSVLLAENFPFLTAKKDLPTILSLQFMKIEKVTSGLEPMAAVCIN